LLSNEFSTAVRYCSTAGGAGAGTKAAFGTRHLATVPERLNMHLSRTLLWNLAMADINCVFVTSCGTGTYFKPLLSNIKPSNEKAVLLKL
jgi:hypothetical protein